MTDDKVESGLSLDRYDPVTKLLTRVPLSFKTPGFMTLVAGKNGLLLASLARAGDRALLLPWTDLDRARWKKVPDVRIDPVESPDG